MFNLSDDDALWKVFEIKEKDYTPRDWRKPLDPSERPKNTKPIPQSGDIDRLCGYVCDIIHSNPLDHYTVLVIDRDEDGMATVSGIFPNIALYDSLVIDGEWYEHSSFGMQFRAHSYTVTPPTDALMIEQYLASGIIPGIAAATARKMVDKFGDKTLDILLTAPEKLAEVRGISLDKAKKLSEAYAERQYLQALVMFLQKYNISAGYAQRIYDSLGSSCINTIEKNPYVLADSVDGISFQSADVIAHSMGLPKNSLNRISSCIRATLKDAAYAQGHTYLSRQSLIDEIVYRLDVSEDEVENALTMLLANGAAVEDKTDGERVCYLRMFHSAEQYTAKRLVTMSHIMLKNKLSEADTDKAIDEYEKRSGTQLALQQRNAVHSAVSSGLMVLTGGPGTGKTTTVKAIIAVLQSMRLSISLAAPTGRAAKRMAQVTGMSASTIHRLLGTQMINGKPVFVHDEDDPLKADVVILDEMSMVDILLMSAFLKALKRGARLILCGDSDQLPSVGAGNVLRDIIASDAVPVIKLDKIFRQAEESLIITNAHKINRGEMPELRVHDNDFFHMERADDENAVITVKELYKNRLPKAYGVNPFTDIQILSPTKKGLTGTKNLNRVLQEFINPPSRDKGEFKHGQVIFREGDKVMQTKNNYDIEFELTTATAATPKDERRGNGIFNGDIGIIESINNDGKYMTIIFDEDKRVDYPFSGAEDLDLAYAITVHKSQGSEFDYVIMPVCANIPRLMSRNLFYTAVTRAKKMVILVGKAQIVGYMVLNDNIHSRYTALSERMSDVRDRLISMASAAGIDLNEDEKKDENTDEN